MRSVRAIFLCGVVSASFGIACAAVPVAGFDSYVELKQYNVTLRNATDIATSQRIENVFVNILVPAGNIANVSKEIRNAVQAGFKSGGMLGESRIVSPSKEVIVGIFDSGQQPVCLITLYVGDVIAVAGLEQIAPGVFQAINDDYWKGTFKSSLLRAELLRIGQSRQ